MSRNRITAEIDDIANGVQLLGKRYPRAAQLLTRVAGRLDLVSNELETRPTKGRKAAPTDTERLPGEWGPEDEYQDSYEADGYHRVPVGKDSVSKAIDKNAADILSDLDFAQTTNGKDGHRIYVQAGQRRRPTRQNGQSRAAGSNWPFADLTPNQLGQYVKSGNWAAVDRAAKMAMNRQ